jgi:hypothetical protein
MSTLRVTLEAATGGIIEPELGTNPYTGSLATGAPSTSNPVRLRIELAGVELVSFELHSDGSSSVQVDRSVDILDGQGETCRLTLSPSPQARRLASGREAEHMLAAAVQLGERVWAGYGCGHGCVDWRWEDNPPTTCSAHGVACTHVVEVEVTAKLDGQVSS